MKFDFKNILIGIFIGVISSMMVAFFLNDFYVEIRVGEDVNQVDED